MTDNFEDRCTECSCPHSWQELQKENMAYLKQTAPQPGEEDWPRYMRYLARIGVIDGYNQGPPEQRPNSPYQSLVDFVRSNPELPEDTEQN